MLYRRWKSIKNLCSMFFVVFFAAALVSISCSVMSLLAAAQRACSICRFHFGWMQCQPLSKQLCFPLLDVCYLSPTVQRPAHWFTITIFCFVLFCAIFCLFCLVSMLDVAVLHTKFTPPNLTMPKTVRECQ